MIACCDVTITPEREKELMGQYKISERDNIDFDRFYDLSLMLAKENENNALDSEALEYGNFPL